MIGTTFATNALLGMLTDWVGKKIGPAVKVTFKTFIDFLTSAKKDKDGITHVDLDPIYITLVAPRGAGKTSLLATVISYINNNITKADGFTVSPCTETDGTRIAQFNSVLSARMQAGSFKFDSGFLRPDNELSKFDFELKFNVENEKTVLHQKFIVMDIPGGWISDNIAFPTEFTEHFHKSRILWIPIEAPALMEVDYKSESEMGHSANVLCIERVGEFIKEWAAIRNKEDEPCSANFAITKCETYHTQDDTKTKAAKCQLRFKDRYQEIINDVHKISNKIKMNYVPIETIGVVKIYDREWWCTEEGRSVLKADYKFTQRRVSPQISGVDALMSTVLEYCYTALDSRINNDIEVLNKAIDDSLFAFKEKKMKEALLSFHKKIEPLKEKMLQLKQPTKFSLDYSISL